MKIFKAGDVGEALAPGRGRVPVVYEYRTVHLAESRIDVDNVLVGACCETGEILAIPAQSTPKLKTAREATKEESFQVRMPEHLHDVLGLLADHYGVSAGKFSSALIRLYLYEAVKKRRLANRLARLSKSDLAAGDRGWRITVRSEPALLRHVVQLAEQIEDTNRSDLVRGAIIAAKEDVFEGYAKRRAAKLEAVARAV